MGITTIRRLEPTDLEALTDIYRCPSVAENTSQLPYLDTGTINALFSGANQYTLVAEVDNQLLGHVTLFLSTKLREKHTASLAIAVHPEAHGQGIGRRLMEEALSQADHWLNLVRIELDVHEDNSGAIELYKKVGFEPEGTKRLATFKAGKYINLLLMSRINLGSTDPT
ncbi:Spermidine N(1)-acetyltransferase [Marinomonas spartinae]|uniref:Spermidine N(1)-acetyltransferase n=1 Tax=Marinomonas spartinae TaxID=1792290 RepID=A0A1A8T5W7_9GAMM|nr:GNAT family N-acetyltransferase [Marinomonas spartinae]SBS27794.1 Spermidine N(1)-acetyltransferase [Marinomonas spartinae]SBS28932.1 Spermidine N(1)-acetyltransferase [Marinomonas spartinae]